MFVVLLFVNDGFQVFMRASAVALNFLIIFLILELRESSEFSHQRCKLRISFYREKRFR